MRLALVTDSPRPSARKTHEYVKRTVAAVEQVSGFAVEYEEIPLLLADNPGGKAPSVAQARQALPDLELRLSGWRPDAIVTCGASPIVALTPGARKAPQVRKEHGRMRWHDAGYGLVPLTPALDPYQVVRHGDLHRDFANVLYKAVTQRAPMPRMDVELHVCSSVAELEAALGLLEGATVVGVDVETTGLSAYRDELLAVGLGAVYDDSSGVAVVADRRLLKLVPDALWDAVWRRSRRSVGHNFKFDMQFLAQVVGMPPREALIGDTLLLAHLVDERPSRPTSRARGSGLKDLVAQRYDYEYGFDFEDFYGTDESERDYDSLHAYLGDDVVYTARLWHDLVAEADAESPRLLECHDRVLAPAARVIAGCELRGAPLDLDWVRETIASLERRIERRTRVLEATVPAVTLSVTNLQSSEQIADLVCGEWGWTPDIRKHGRVVEDDRSVDKEHLEAAVAKYEHVPGHERRARWVRSLLRLRKDARAVTTYQKSLLDRADDDGRVRASFLLHGTATGRLSSSGPNLQNVPAVKRVGADTVRPMRRAFRPGPGRLWCDVDYSQLELRVAAAISGDTAFGDVFRSGRDIHREIASSIFAKPPDRIDPAERFMAKAVSFGIIYGRSPEALAGGAEMEYAKRELGMKPWTSAQAAVFINKFLSSYPQLHQWMTDEYMAAPARGYVESPFGRRRRFPLYPSSRSELGSVQRQAVNTPVQSAASDVCLTAMTRLSDRFEDQPDLDAAVLFSVHDSICIECPETSVAEVERIAREVMEIEFMGVPLTVDFSPGPDWATSGGWSGR